MSKSAFLLIIAALLCCVAAFIYIEGVHARGAPQVQATQSSQKTVQIGGKTIKVDVVDNEAAREKGLGGRSGLAADEGMLFVFQKDDIYPFWMKDMSFSIDIVWLSADKRIVYIAENVPPSSYPSTFSPKTVARFVLELPAGYTSANKIEVGDFAQF